MKTIQLLRRPARRVMALLTFLFFAGGLCRGQQDASTPVWRYVLLNGSYLLDDCPVCARPSIQEPMQGSFDLRLIQTTPLGSRYSIENVNFTAGTSRNYVVKGVGEFNSGGEVAVVQRISLEVEIDDGSSKKAVDLQSDAAPASRMLPMMDVTAEQLNGTLTQVFSLRIAAAPIRDLWFSTTSFFTPGAGPEASNLILGGDLLSMTGRVVKRNHEFYGSIGATPPGPDLGLDAIDVLPGGEMAFSLDSGFPQTNVGPVFGGDLLSTKGRVIRRNGDLMAPFGLQPIAPDTGLDAVQFVAGGEILFSIETDIFSEKLGKQLHHGDLLSSTGSVVRTWQQLYEKFHPQAPATDPGLDALFRWPGGEIWFSPETSFNDDQFGPVTAGDLLSDQGYIVYRNAELLSAFAPLQATAGLGLDALFIVTDITSPPAAAQLNIAVKPDSPDIFLTWQSTARVFQMERTVDLAAPFVPVSPVIPDQSWSDPGGQAARSRAFYRLRQW